MTWLHNDTTASLKRLVTDADNNSDYQVVAWDIEGHFKKLDLADGSFDVSGIDGTAYKFSVKKYVDIKGSDRLIIATWEFAGEYSVQDFKFTKGVTFQTTKILVIK